MFNICRRCCSKCNCYSKCYNRKCCNRECCNRECCNRECCNRECCNRECCNRECCNRNCCNRKCYNRGMDKFEVTMDQLVQMQAQGAIVCDIRSPQEYNEGHLQGAVLLPEYDIYRNALKIFPNKEQLIILYCGTGSRSYSSLMKFQRLGYSNVYNLYKGTENYSGNLFE